MTKDHFHLRQGTSSRISIIKDSHDGEFRLHTPTLSETYIDKWDVGMVQNILDNKITEILDQMAVEQASKHIQGSNCGHEHQSSHLGTRALVDGNRISYDEGFISSSDWYGDGKEIYTPPCYDHEPFKSDSNYNDAFRNKTLYPFFINSEFESKCISFNFEELKRDVVEYEKTIIKTHPYFAGYPKSKVIIFNRDYFIDGEAFEYIEIIECFKLALPLHNDHAPIRQEKIV